MITSENLVRHELIGLACRVKDSTNKALTGLEGRVVDETRQTLTLEIQNREKSLIKDQCVFSFQIPSGKWVRVEGKILVARPEDRIKKKFKSW